MDALPDGTAIIVIDHGSKRDEANRMLLGVVAQFQAVTGSKIVEAAHMELAEPTLEDAVKACIAQGARQIVVHPYFLAPGRHSTEDIPAMVEALAPQYPEITFRVTEPLGIAPQMAEVMQQRIHEALA